MEFSTWLLFSGFAIVATLSPGPAVLLSVTNSLTHGFTKSVYSSLGNITGIMVVSIAAALGLGAVLQTSVLLFTVLKSVGALYLIFLGLRQWMSKNPILSGPFGDSRFSQGRNMSFVQGFTVAVSNPKAILFFTAFFPQFMDLSKPILFQFAVLTATFMLFSFIALIIYALSAQYATSWFSRGSRGLWFNRFSGSIYIAFGFGMLRLRNRSA